MLNRRFKKDVWRGAECEEDVIDNLNRNLYVTYKEVKGLKVAGSLTALGYLLYKMYENKDLLSKNIFVDKKELKECVKDPIIKDTTK